jgi:hypothetical protein
MPNGRTCGLALWLMTAMMLGSDASAASPITVEKGERYFLSAPVSYWIYQADAKKCGLPLDKVKCQGDKDLTNCAYSQGACEWAYVADNATDEKVTLYSSDANCGGFTLTGEWPALLFASAQECLKAVPASRDFMLEKVLGTYGSRMIVRRKSD